MTTDRRDSLRNSLRRIVDEHAATMAVLEQTYTLLCEELALGPPEPVNRSTAPGPSADPTRPIIDESRFTVAFRGGICCLGNTLRFRLLARLAQAPERYVSHQDLIDDLWDGDCTDDALRSVVKHLRRRLREAGLGELARAVKGCVKGHFALRLGQD